MRSAPTKPALPPEYPEADTTGPPPPPPPRIPTTLPEPPPPGGGRDKAHSAGGRLCRRSSLRPRREGGKERSHTSVATRGGGPKPPGGGHRSPKGQTRHHTTWGHCQPDEPWPWRVELEWRGGRKGSSPRRAPQGWPRSDISRPQPHVERNRPRRWPRTRLAEGTGHPAEGPPSPPSGEEDGPKRWRRGVGRHAERVTVIGRPGRRGPGRLRGR